LYDSLRNIVADGDRTTRTNALRALRYVLTDKEGIKEFAQFNIDLFVAR